MTAAAESNRVTGYTGWAIYSFGGVWCPADCGSYILHYSGPAYGSSSDYIVWCPNCRWVSGD